MAEELIEPVEREITNSKYKYEDLEVSLKEYSGESIHNVVVALKRAGKSQEINGNNISSFLSKARGEIVAEAKAVAEAEMEIAKSLVDPIKDDEVLDEEEEI